MMELLTDLDRGVDRCCTCLFSRPYLNAVNEGRVFLSLTGYFYGLWLVSPEALQLQSRWKAFPVKAPTACHW